MASEMTSSIEVISGLVTPGEAWTSRRAMEAEPMLKSVFTDWDQVLANYPAAFWGQGPDIVATVFGMFTMVDSPAPVVNGEEWGFATSELPELRRAL